MYFTNDKTRKKEANSVTIYRPKIELLSPKSLNKLLFIWAQNHGTTKHLHMVIVGLVTGRAVIN